MNLEYISGLFDGEGNINMSRGHSQICITNTCREVLEEIQQFLRMGEIYQREKIQNRKECYNLRIFRRKEVEDFINLILPKVIIKKNELLKLKEHLKNNPQKHFPIFWSKEEIKILSKLYFEGKTWKEIGRALGRSYGSIRGGFKSYGKEFGYPKSGEKFVPKKFL